MEEPISNFPTIMSEINEKLGVDKNPSIEYLLIRPYSNFSLFKCSIEHNFDEEYGYYYDTDFSGQGNKNLNCDYEGIGINYNSFGHSAVRYTTPEGHDVIVNIHGKEIINGEKKVMVRFYDAKDYLYGIGEKTGEQKGVYNRDIVGIRIENVDPKKVEQMHNYFLRLIEDEKLGLVKFNIFFGPIINLFREIFQLPEYGNCAKWISTGLYRAGVTTAISVYPKSILINIFENYEQTTAKSKENINIVYYEKPLYLQPKYGVNYNKLFELVAPFQILRSYLYSNLEDYSNVIVKISKESNNAIVNINNKPITQSKSRNIVNNYFFIVGTTILNIWLTLKFVKNVRLQLKSEKYRNFKIKQLNKIEFYQQKVSLWKNKQFGIKKTNYSQYFLSFFKKLRL
jgi:hypothetical protein